MKIVFGIPFDEYARQRNISQASDVYLELKSLYNQIQQINEFISHSYQFRPIGLETARMYFERLKTLGVEDEEKDRLINNVGEIQSFVDAHIQKATAKQGELNAAFEKLLTSTSPSQDDDN
jgi:hypothetical protein